MWDIFKQNPFFMFLAALLFATAQIYGGYQASQVSVNLNNLTSSMMVISDRSVENSKKIDETQKSSIVFQDKIFRKFNKTQSDMLKLQERVFERVWEQDKVLAQMNRDTAQMERENLLRREILQRNKKLYK